MERLASESILERLKTELLLLRNLFVDFHTHLSSLEQQGRLSQALDLASPAAAWASCDQFAKCFVV